MYHCPITQEPAGCTKAVRDKGQGCGGVGFQVPECAPRSVIIDLECIVGGSVEKDGQGRGHNDYFEGDNP